MVSKLTPLPKITFSPWLLAALIFAAFPVAASTTSNVSFYARRDFAIQGPPYSLAIGDFNGDGVPDMVTTAGGSTVAVMLGIGDGTFQPASYFSSGTPPISNFAIMVNTIVVGDFNGDRKLDVAVAVAGGIAVLLGNGDGTFQAPMVAALPNPWVASVAIGDFNGDGKLDLVASDSSASSNVVSVLTGNGDGTFVVSANVAVPEEAGPLAIGDFNRDGKLDFVSANNQTISVVLGNGDGTFKPATNLAISATSIVTADFNSDGKLDLAVTTATTPAFYMILGNGDGTFQTPETLPYPGQVYSLAVRDFNGDSKPDLVATSTLGVVILLGKGDGTFLTAQTLTAASAPVPALSPAVADFNGDGKLDVATAGGQSDLVSIFLGRGDGTFVQASLSMFSSVNGVNVLASADFNGDGKADLALGGSNQSLLIALGNGNGTFRSGVANELGNGEGSLTQILTADFNGDGKPDVIVTGSPYIAVFLSNGDGTFQNGKALDATGRIGALADFNRDGKLDIAVINGNFVDIYLGNGDGTFGIGLVLPVVAGSLYAGDFNGDGIPDLAVGESITSSTHGIQIYLGKGDGTFQSPLVPISVPNLSAIVGADFNKDGHLDLAASEGSQIFILLGNGDGTFEPAVPYNSISGTSILADMNGDGNLDLVTAGGTDVAVLLGNGDGTFQPAQYFGSLTFGGEAYPNNVVAADFNGDGKLDIAVASPASNLNVGGISLLLTGGPGFALMTGSSPTTASISAGQSATYMLQLAPTNGFSGTVQMSCAGLPANATCSVTPNPIGISGLSSIAITVTVNTTAKSGTDLLSVKYRPSSPQGELAFRFALGLFFLALLISLKMARRPLALEGAARRPVLFGTATTVALFFVLWAGGCGGGPGSSSSSSPNTPAPPPSGGTPTGTYTLAITATSGTLAQNVTVVLTVN